ncbi:MAG: sigma-54 dependent transcriptional regulator [Kiritimatiellae bacterium]|jgi:DNA-binding NtrC family response regulator|nr:sigma-54 dependent transcriptional regulator [Kiritimatiellia bacterium]
MTKILIVDDEARILMLLQSLLKANNYEVLTAKSGEVALTRLKEDDTFDIVITDLRMSPMDGMTLFHEIKKIYPAIPVILLTAYASVETAIDAMKNGAFDYMTKPFKVDELIAILKRAEEHIKKEGGSVASKADEPLRYHFENLIATNAAMQYVCDMIERVAPTSATVLINGESGTGKEVIARSIHTSSPRKNEPWIAVNCAALPEHLLESEMFGHIKGAFTGAANDKIGLFESANNGTLFLDEISSLPLLLQGKLLRVLQEKEIRRVGDNKSIQLDVRVIAASNTNLEQMVVQGSFRADLFYRFAVITLDIPPLRERTDDILPLAKHFIKSECFNHYIEREEPSLSKDAADILMNYSWPGNVRELENAIKHAITFLQGDAITPELLPPRILQRTKDFKAAQNNTNANDRGNTSLKGFLKLKEKEYLEQILSSTNGNKEKAAETLKVSLATLYRKLADDDDDETPNAAEPQPS